MTREICAAHEARRTGRPSRINVHKRHTYVSLCVLTRRAPPEACQNYAMGLVLEIAWRCCVTVRRLLRFSALRTPFDSRAERAQCGTATMAGDALANPGLYRRLRECAIRSSTGKASHGKARRSSRAASSCGTWHARRRCCHAAGKPCPRWHGIWSRRSPFWPCRCTQCCKGGVSTTRVVSTEAHTRE